MKRKLGCVNTIVVVLLLLVITKVDKVQCFVRDGLSHEARVAKTQMCYKKCGFKKVGKGVCGTTGIRYHTDCHRTCFSTNPAPDSVCSCEQQCGFVQRKVCGTDGNWHRNSCVLKCHDVSEANPILCQCVDDCESDGLKRVCSTNGKLYLNRCALACVGGKERQGGRTQASCKQSATGSIPTY